MNYVDWLEKRMVHKNKTSIVVDRQFKRMNPDIVVKKRKKKSVNARNVYLEEIEHQIKSLKQQNAQQIKTLTSPNEIKNCYLQYKKIEKMEQLTKLENLKHVKYRLKKTYKLPNLRNESTVT